MKLTITESRARVENPGAVTRVVEAQLEGRKHRLTDGSFSFEPSQHNISTWLAAFPETEVIDLSSTIEEASAPPRGAFAFKREPLDHQRKAFDKLKDKAAFGLFFDPGAGKSKALTDIICYKWTQNLIDAAVILSPNQLVSEQWARIDDEEPGQLQRDARVPFTALLWDTKRAGNKSFKEAYAAFRKSSGLQVICMNIDAIKTKNGQNLLADFIKAFGGRVLFGIDESHLVKNKESQRHKIAATIAGLCKHRAILTGTPIGKSLLDVWAQFRILDERIIGIRYKTAFMSKFCETRHNGFGIEIVGHKNIDEFQRIIDPHSYRISQEELGLKKMYDEFVFDMSDEQKQHYKTLKEAFLVQLDNDETMTVANALAQMTRLQQISNGFLPREDGTFLELPNPRLDALEAWLESLEDEKVMIWCRFKQDANRIMKRLKNCVDLSGNVADNERIENKNLFVRDAKVTRAVGTPDAAGTGMDGLQSVCNRAIRYSMSYNYILHRQAEDRTSRVGGKGTAFFTDLIGRGTQDRKILRALQTTDGLSKMTLDDFREILK